MYWYVLFNDDICLAFFLLLHSCLLHDRPPYLTFHYFNFHVESIKKQRLESLPLESLPLESLLLQALRRLSLVSLIIIILGYMLALFRNKNYRAEVKGP